MFTRFLSGTQSAFRLGHKFETSYIIFMVVSMFIFVFRYMFIGLCICTCLVFHPYYIFTHTCMYSYGGDLRAHLAGQILRQWGAQNQRSGEEVVLKICRDMVPYEGCVVEPLLGVRPSSS